MNAIQTLAISALPVIFAITLHEAAHGYAARHFGDPTAWQAGRISINPLRHVDLVGTIIVPAMILLLSAGSFLFGWAKPVPVNFGRLRHPKQDMLWVAAAGPGVNLLMALGWGLLLKMAVAMPVHGYSQAMAEMARVGININGVLMVLNLLPLPPLDGGRIAVSLLPHRQAAQFSSNRTVRHGDSVGAAIHRCAGNNTRAAAGPVHDADEVILESLTMYAEKVLSGMRPTGRLHLGHYHGVLANWIKLQHEYPCLFFVADWHALTTAYDEPGTITQNTWDMVIDWLAAGVDPSQATFFIQSRVPEHAELHLLMSMMTPLGWLERVPTYKDQQEKLTHKDLTTYGFLGYPAAAGGGHSHLPRQSRAGGRGSGAAHRVHPGNRPSFQSPVWSRTGLRGQGEGVDKEAGQQARQAV